MRATSTVGICDESANGSSYIEASCGTTSSASPALTYSSVCEVPRCAATALACSASLKAGSSQPIENVLTACAADSSEERRVGKECVRTCRYWLSTDH